MRQRWIQDRETGRLIPEEEYVHQAPAPYEIIPDYEPYQCPVTGKVISGRRQHRENLKRHGCHVGEAGEREACERTIRNDEQAMMRRVEQTLADRIGDMRIDG